MDNVFVPGNSCLLLSTTGDDEILNRIRVVFAVRVEIALINMQLIGRCGLCEKCMVLASMAGVVHNAALAVKTDYSLDTPRLAIESQFLPEFVPERKQQEITVTVETNKFEHNETVTKESEPTTMESWCVIWYLGAFGCLVCFFLIITCTELFFGNPLYRTENLNTFVHGMISSQQKPFVPETPPPPYHLFAPPDYNETIQKIVNEKRKSLDIFVVPVHNASAFAPPAYEQITRKIIVEKVDETMLVPGKSNPTFAI